MHHELIEAMGLYGKLEGVTQIAGNHSHSLEILMGVGKQDCSLFRVSALPVCMQTTARWYMLG